MTDPPGSIQGIPATPAPSRRNSLSSQHRVAVNKFWSLWKVWEIVTIYCTLANYTSYCNKIKCYEFSLWEAIEKHYFLFKQDLIIHIYYLYHKFVVALLSTRVVKLVHFFGSLCLNDDVRCWCLQYWVCFYLLWDTERATPPCDL